ncbi:MAG: SPOR domain-containing protein [Bacteroidetes bacterium]|nr:SPOR domain-containing protein [Bacteroidota bacterium]
MTRTSLINIIEKSLNYSGSYGEYAYSSLIKNISAKLEVDEAIKLNGIGVFQKKREPLTREERKSLLTKETERINLVFTPQKDKIDSDTRNLFLTIELDDHSTDSSTFNEKVFSLGFNQPLINFSPSADIVKSANPVENIYAELDRKLDGLISSGTILKNYNIWDEFLEADFSSRSSETVKEPLENIVDQIGVQESLKVEQSSEEAAPSKSKLLEIQTEDMLDPIDASNDLDDLEKDLDLDALFEDQQVKSDEMEEIIPVIEKRPEIKEEKIIEEKVLDKDKKVKTEDATEKKMDWGFSEDLISEMSPQPEVTRKFDTTKSDDKKKSLFDQLDDYLREDDPAEQVEHLVLDGSAQTDFVPEKSSKSYQSPKENHVLGSSFMTMEDFKDTPEFEKEDEEKIIIEKKPWYKKPILIGFIAASIIGAYFIFSPNNITVSRDDGEQTETTKTADSKLTPEESEKIEQAKQQIISSTQSEKPKAAETKKSGIYRVIENDRRVANQIYFDGKQYTIQLSSWQNEKIAEREVNRLKQKRYDAFIFQISLEKKGIWNRVRIGYFKSIAEAEDFLLTNKF